MLREVVGVEGRWWEWKCAKRGGGSGGVLREVVVVEVC